MLGSVQRATLIVNPYSSSVTDERIEAVEAVLRNRIDLQTLRTAAPRHAVELARGAAADGAILVYSGDGGFNEVLNGLDVDVPVGFVPGGRTNVLSRALGLPRDPIGAARQVAEALERGRTRRISLGRVNGRRFAFAAGIGADAELIRRIDTWGRSPDGQLSGDVVAAWLLARQLADHRGRYEAVLEVRAVGRAALVLVANGSPSTFLGRVPLHLVPCARFELGLDFVAPSSLRLGMVPAIVANAVRRRRNAPFRYGHDLDLIEVVCDRLLPLQADGEDLGDIAGVTFEAERSAVSVLV